jgi:hypothetical protein
MIALRASSFLPSIYQLLSLVSQNSHLETDMECFSRVCSGIGPVRYHVLLLCLERFTRAIQVLSLRALLDIHGSRFSGCQNIYLGDT